MSTEYGTEPYVVVSTRVPLDLQRRLQAIARDERRPLSSVVRRALQAAVAQRQAPAPPSGEKGQVRCQ